MKTQNYSNHTRFYIPHHFIFYPVIIIAIGICVYMSFENTDESYMWYALAFSFFMTMSLSFMLRQHYALNNQNRIVRLEMRYRYYVLTGERLELFENQLSFSQIAALRFASDEELPKLVNSTLVKKLTPKEIKKQITYWQPDYMRA